MEKSSKHNTAANTKSGRTLCVCVSHKQSFYSFNIMFHCNDRVTNPLICTGEFTLTVLLCVECYPPSAAILLSFYLSFFSVVVVVVKIQPYG